MEMAHWTRELVESLPFRVLTSYPFARSSHMNVNEHRVYKTLAKICAKTWPGTRSVFFGDSMVSGAVAAKGRSSSKALNRLQITTLPYVLGSNVRLGPLRVDTKTNPSDDPTRDVPLRAPSRPVPLWYDDLSQNDFRDFDLIAWADQFRIPLCFWVRLLLRAGRRFDSTLGFPGEGPRRRRATERSADLELPRLSPIESRRRLGALELFWSYVDEADVSRTTLMESPLLCSATLRSFGKRLYREDYPIYLYVQAILGIRDLCPHFRSELGLAWQVAARWEADEPTEPRAVLPTTAVRGIICLSFLWGWRAFGACVMLGFSGMLRPCEWLVATRAELLLPSDLLEGTQAFLSVLAPKTRRTYRRQHVAIDEILVIDVLEALWASARPTTRLFPLSSAAFRKRWDAVVGRLGIAKDVRGKSVTPACLRGSGATALYRRTSDLRLVQWRGRWSKPQTLEAYIQEAASSVALLKIPPDAVEDIRCLSDALSDVVAWSLASHQAPSKRSKVLKDR